MDYIRKLVSVKKIDNILPIEGADRIELAQFGGWKVIIQKEFIKLMKMLYISRSIHSFLFKIY